MASVRVYVLILVVIAPLALCATSGTRTPPKYVVSLDAPEEKRWAHVVMDYPQLVQFIQQMFDSYIPPELVSLVEEIATDVDNYIKAPYAGEMRGIAEALNISTGEVVGMNLIYDVTAFCTSIVSQDMKGQIWHSRNLDYDFGEMLRNITVAVDFTKGGQTVYSAITYASYIGILTGQKPKAFTVTVDERDQGNILLNLLVAILDRKTDPVSFLVRDALASNDTFENAISRLAYTPTAAPVYFIIAGASPGEGAVITKGRLGPDDIWRIDPDKGRWYEVETNYDHWTTPPPNDNRRTPAINAMNAMGRQAISVTSLFNVMSTHPVLNPSTTYTIVMSAAQPDIMTTWIRL